jgi:serine/threonine protein kinase
VAPERIDGAEADVRSDIYSFGVVLYEMIAGRRPFAGDSRVELIAAIAAGDLPPLSTVQPATPRALDRVVRRCLARDVEHRWQTARDLGAELRWIREGGSGSVDPRVPAPRRHGRLLTLGALLLALAAIATPTCVASAISSSSAASSDRQHSRRTYDPGFSATHS